MKTRRSWSRFLALAAVLLFAGGLVAHVRLRFVNNGNLLFWSGPNNVSIVINSTGSDNIADGSHETAMRNAILTWNEDDQTNARLVENTNPGQQARTDWPADNIHLMLFDENNSSGFFPGSSGTVAITPISFFTSGQIIDADILFNGKDFDFTTSGTFGDFDVQNVATHELGHLLGLDHTGWASATMYPFVDPQTELQRSLSLDEIRGMRATYPNGAFGAITGTVRRMSDNSVVSGAQIVVRDSEGRTAGGRLANGNGVFSVQGLDPGDYTVYATPLDQPVSSLNVQVQFPIHVDFGSTVFSTVTVGAGATVALGDVFVEPDATVSLGRASNEFPIHVEAGQTTGSITLFGAGLSTGNTLVSSDLSSNPVIVTASNWTGNTVRFSVTVPAGTAPGHLDLIASDGVGTSILVAALEITPPPPGVGSVSPASADFAGGANLLIQGVNFNPGTRVVIADQIYEDGVSGGCTVVDSNTITLTTRSSDPSLAGIHDVVVLDSSGVEGRNDDAFQITVTPTITTLFPVAGATAGATLVTVTGQDFAPDATVTIGGIPQTVLDQSATEISLMTSAGAGSPMLTVSSNGAQASAQFTYISSADPQLDTVLPPTGSELGGQVVTLIGSDFTSDAEVLFGVNQATGAGGVPAASLQFVDSTTLIAVTPSQAPGTKNVLVRDTSTQQVSVLSAGFTSQAVPDPGGGGGCGVIMPSGPPTWMDLLSGGAWFVLLLAVFAWRRQAIAIA